MHLGSHHGIVWPFPRPHPQCHAINKKHAEEAEEAEKKKPYEDQSYFRIHRIPHAPNSSLSAMRVNEGHPNEGQPRVFEEALCRPPETETSV